MATGNLHKKLYEDRSSDSRDMLVDRQTCTHRQRENKLITILRSLTVTIPRL